MGGAGLTGRNSQSSRRPLHQPDFPESLLHQPRVGKPDGGKLQAGGNVVCLLLADRSLRRTLCRGELVCSSDHLRENTRLTGTEVETAPRTTRPVKSKRMAVN